MKRPSEAEFGAALRAVDLRLYVFKPSDRDINWKPCDFMTWLDSGHDDADAGPGVIRHQVYPNWFEVKDVDAVNAFPFSELRPSQYQGIADADRVGIPYWLAVYWRRHKAWTISDAVKVIEWKLQQVAAATDLAGIQPKSIDRTLLMSRFGVESSKSLLSSTLKSVLLGEV
jgi:hypothetical protein